MEKYFAKLCFSLCLVVCLGSFNSYQTRPADARTDGDIQINHTKKIAITFDDGPNPRSTPILLDELKKRGVRASFFVIGKYAEAYPELVKREVEEGHLVGNHTYNHVDIRTLDDASVVYEIKQTDEVLKEITGEASEFVRPPFGEWRKSLNKLTAHIPVLWSIDPLDWTTENEEEIINKVVTEIEENDIILLHDCYESSVRAAIRMIDILSAQGYQFVTVEELLLD